MKRAYLVVCMGGAVAFACSTSDAVIEPEGDVQPMQGAPEDAPAATEPAGGTPGGTTGAAPPASTSSGGQSGPRDDPNTCEWEGAPGVDVSKLPNCGPKASCVPEVLVPPGAKDLLGTCEGGGACVPNVFLEKNGKFTLAKCRSVYKAEGRCLTTAIPLVKSTEALLPKDTCDEGERCVPCYEPFGGTDTTLCRQSCDKGPAEPAKLAPKCCPRAGRDRGTCVPKDLVPPGGAADFIEEGTCSAAEPGAYVCIPEEITKVGTTPTKCTGSIFLLGRYEGVCLSNCFASTFVTNLLGRGNCADQESKCVPCTNPLDGTPTGLPGCPGATGLPLPGGPPAGGTAGGTTGGTTGATTGAAPG